MSFPESILTPKIIPNAINGGLIDQNIQNLLSVDVAQLFEKYHVLVAANRLHEIKNTQSLTLELLITL